jgi:hypothetical protein
MRKTNKEQRQVVVLPVLAGERKKVVAVLSVLADGRTKAVLILPKAEISCQTPFKYWVFLILLCYVLIFHI